MVKAVQSLFKLNFSIIMSLALILAWLFETRFTGLLFLDSTQVLQSSFFSLTIAGTFLLCLPLVRTSVRNFLSRRNISVLFGGVLTLLAVFSTLLPYFSSFPEDELHYGRYILNGLLVGIVIFGIFMFGVSFYKQHELKTSWHLLISSALIALLLLATANWLIPWRLGYLHALLPVFSFCFFLYSLRRNESNAPGESSPRVLISNSKPILYKLLLFFSGFYVVYMPTMFPKTTNLTIGYYQDSSLGAVNYASLVALFLFITFLVLLLFFARGHTTGTPFIAFFVTVIFALAFYFLSTMNTSNLAFMIIMPCAIIFALCACCVYLAAIDLKQAQGLHSLQLGLTWLFSGGFFAALFSTLFLGPLFNAYLFQDILFALMVGSVFIINIVLFIGIRSDLAMLLFPTIIFKEKLDSSFLENRCTLIAGHYKLTGRECEVLSLLAEGRNEPYIADALIVSRATVKTHIKHIYQKIDVSSRQELLDLFYGK
jgi:DNA-binding CsgD family transcriptional regulator